MSAIVNITPTVDLVGNLFADFIANATGSIKSIVDNGGGSYTINTCDTGWIRIGSVVPIDGNDYTVTAFVQGVSITVFSDTNSPIGRTLFTLPIVHYFHNTRFGQVAEYVQIPVIADRLPLVWLYEVFRETFNNDDENPLDRTSALRMFFLDNSNFEDWTNDEHYENVLVQMANLAASFVAYLKNHPQIGEFDEHFITSHKNFGEVTQSGHTESYLTDNTSGVELTIALPIEKDFSCKNC